MNMYVVTAGPINEAVRVFRRYSEAVKWAEDVKNHFHIYEFEVDGDGRRLVWGWNLTEQQCAEISIMMPKMYVKTPPEMLVRAVRKILKNNPHWTIKTLAEKIGRTEKWFEELFENNPEPPMPVAEVRQDDSQDDRGKSAQSHPSSAPDGWDCGPGEGRGERPGHSTSE